MSNDNPFKINDKSLFELEQDRDKDKENKMVFDNSSQDQPSQSATNNFVGSSFSTKKRKLFIIIVFALFSIISARLFYLQVINKNNFYAKAEENRQRSIPIPSKRGLIFDRFGNKLTENIPRFSLAITPQDLPHTKKEREKVIKKLSQLTNQPSEKVKKLIEKYKGYNFESVVIKENIDYETALNIQISASNLPGVHIQRGSRRLYHLNPKKSNEKNKKIRSLSHILGYLGKINEKELENKKSKGYLPSDYVGKSGLEKKYESVLRGKYGEKIIEVNSRGERQKVISEQASKPGKHLKLSLDVNIQKKLEQILKENQKEKDYKKSAAIVLNPNNGEILALVSLPSYDNNNFSGGIEKQRYKKYINDPKKPLFNRAVAGEYPPGSTIKPMIGAAALQEGIVNKNTVFNSTGGIEVGNDFFPDWKKEGHGYTNITKAIAWSVNTYFYYIGGGYEDFEGLGLKKIRNYLNKFGFSKRTGIDLPEESTGFLPTKKWKRKTKERQWFIGDTYNLSIGQGDILVTPLQIANATAAIANEGMLYKPRLVDKILDPRNEKVKNINKQVQKKQLIKKNSLELIKQGMLECVVYGSCQRLSSLPFDLGGKTGTAQWSNSNKPHAWFTSFAPYENPKVVVTILVEEGGSGDEVTVPIALDFFEWWSQYRNKNKTSNSIID